MIIAIIVYLIASVICVRIARAKMRPLKFKFGVVDGADHKNTCQATSWSSHSLRQRYCNCGAYKNGPQYARWYHWLSLPMVFIAWPLAIVCLFMFAEYLPKPKSFRSTEESIEDIQKSIETSEREFEEFKAETDAKIRRMLA